MSGVRYSNRSRTTIPLTNGAEYLADGEQTHAPGVLVSVFTDVACTVKAEFSHDNVNWDSSLTYKTVASFHEFQPLLAAGRWFRLRITNDSGGDMTFLRAYCTFGDFAQIPTSPLNSTIGADSPALIVRSISEEIAIASGKFSGFSIQNKFGRNPDIDSGAVPEDVWAQGGLYTGFADSAEILEVFSSSGLDTSAGTGARTVRVYGLDANFEEIEETVILDGTTAVDTVNSYLRAQTAEVLTAGSTGENQGSITVRQSVTTANVMCTLPAGGNRTQVCAVTMPANVTGKIRTVGVALFGAASNRIEGSIMIREEGGVFQNRRPFVVSGGGQYSEQIYGGVSLPPKSDCVVRIDNASANGLEVTARLDILKEESLT